MNGDEACSPHDREGCKLLMTLPDGERVLELSNQHGEIVAETTVGKFRMVRGRMVLDSPGTK